MYEIIGINRLTLEIVIFFKSNFGSEDIYLFGSENKSPFTKSKEFCLVKNGINKNESFEFWNNYLFLNS